MKKALLAMMPVFLLAGTLQAGGGFYKRAKKHKDEYRKMAQYLISKGYHKNFSEKHFYIEGNTNKDIVIRDFCRKFKITELVVQGKYDYQGKSGKFVEDSVIIFERRYTPVLGARREIIIDCSAQQKDYPDYEGYGQEQIRIEKGMYYFRH